MVEGARRHVVAPRDQQHLDAVGAGLRQGCPGGRRDLVIPGQQGAIHIECDGLVLTHSSSSIEQIRKELYRPRPGAPMQVLPAAEAPNCDPFVAQVQLASC